MGAAEGGGLGRVDGLGARTRLLREITKFPTKCETKVREKKMKEERARRWGKKAEVIAFCNCV